MGAITIRPQEARDILNRLSALNNEQFNAFDKLYNYISAISLEWSGEMPSAANDRLSRTNTIASAITGEMNTYLEALMFAIIELEEADRRAAEQKARGEAAKNAGAGIAGSTSSSPQGYSPVPGMGINHAQQGYGIRRAGIASDGYYIIPETGKTGHTGYDFLGKIGDSIVSPADGKVVHVQNNPKGFGYYAIIEYQINGKYYYANFAHLNKLPNLSVGQSVAAGVRIGEMGMSGTANGVPHLHFDIRTGMDDTKPITSAANFFNTSAHKYRDPKEFFNAIGVQI